VHQDRLDEGPTLDTYAPYAQAGPVWSMAVTLRSQKSPALLTNSLRASVLSIDKDQPLTRIAVLRDLVGQSYEQRRFQVVMVGGFGLLALVLAGIGIYGVMAYSVEQRRQELGIRMALGATRQRLFYTMLGEALAITAAGMLIGVAAALGLVRLIRALLYQVTATDLLSYVLACAVVVTAVLLASYIPARRAMNVDPIIALKDQ